MSCVSQIQFTRAVIVSPHQLSTGPFSILCTILVAKVNPLMSNYVYQLTRSTLADPVADATLARGWFSNLTSFTTFFHLYNRSRHLNVLVK